MDLDLWDCFGRKIIRLITEEIRYAVMHLSNDVFYLFFVFSILLSSFITNIKTFKLKLPILCSFIKQSSRYNVILSIILSNFSLFLNNSIYCYPSLELSQRDSSNDGSQKYVLWRNIKKSSPLPLLSGTLVNIHDDIDHNSKILTFLIADIFAATLVFTLHKRKPP